MNIAKTLRGKNAVWVVAALLVICCIAAGVVLSGHLFRSTTDADLIIDLLPESEEQAFRTLPLSQRSQTSGSSDGAHGAVSGSSSRAKVSRLNHRKYVIEDADGTVWTTDTKVDIFKTSYENGKQAVTVAGANGEKVIAPGTENSYTFSLRNNGAGFLDYKMTMNAFFSGLPDGKVIPVEVRVKSMNGWLLGDDSTWAPVLDLSKVEDSAVLSYANSAVYTLEWRWPFESGDDAWDTWLGSQQEDITLTIQINTQSSYHDPEIPAITVPIPDLFNSEDHIAYVVGYEDGTVRPNANITRAEVATIFYRLAKSAIREQYETDQHPYPDIPADAWYRTEVATMTNMGIFNGYPDGTFRGDDPITRAELATAFANLSRAYATRSAAETKFPDIAGHWAEQNIIQIEQFNWILGYEDGTFRPDNYITRAETVTLVNRALHRMPEKLTDLHEDMHIWPDNADPEAWYYIAIQEASHTHTYIRLRGTREKWINILKWPVDRTPL